MTDVPGRRLDLTREQILAHRLVAGHLDNRLPAGADSLRRAAWIGLQDSMPRSALLSIHARVEETTPSSWEDPSLVQVWGPRFSAYVVPDVDRALFTLARLPDGGAGRRRAEDHAQRLEAFLAGRRMAYSAAGRGLGLPPNSLRYAAPTGTVLIRWEGARQPVIWSVARPDVDPLDARLELARRYVHVLGPTTPGTFAEWAGLKPHRGPPVFEALAAELVAVRTPIGDSWILAADEESFRSPRPSTTGVRLLPSGDAYVLFQDRKDRTLLVPDAGQRARLWTPRVWPGALLVDAEIVGTWRRANADVSVEPWRALAAAEQEVVEREAASLPLPGLVTPIRVHWADPPA